MEFKITPASQTNLKETAKWAKFLSIVGFVFIGLMTLLCLLMMVASTSLSKMMLGVYPAAFIIGYSIFLLALLVVDFFITYFQYIFAVRALSGLETGSESDIDESFENLKKCYRLNGIMTIIMLGIMALSIVFVIIAVIVAAAM